jgi:outer membrane protein OmpA-like peptidoglycan-associated protein
MIEMIMNKNYVLWVAFLLLSGCAASSHPDYKPMYQKVDVQQDKIDTIRQQFHDQGLNDAVIGRDAIGRLKLEGAYASEKDVAKAFDIARSVAGASAVSPVTPSSIKRKDWEVGLTEGLAQYIDRIAKKYNMSVATSPIKSDEVAKQKKSDDIGLDTQVFDAGLNGESQFQVGLSEPSSKARQFYTEIAKKMAEDYTSESGTPIKKILLIGHTDDTGDTHFNAKLSEDRARAIGQIFANAGIDSANIFYQGAGEFLPIADNTSIEGRAKNRRVELAEMMDEQAFNLFLINRRPNTAFYRPVKTQSSKSQSSLAKTEDGLAKASESDKNSKISSKASKDSPVSVSEKVTSETNKKLIARKDQLDFGGRPINTTNAKLNAGDFVMTKTAFSFISNAQAAVPRIDACIVDRPRNSGLVKSLKDDSAYKNSDYLPGLYGRTWFDMAGNNLVVLNKVTVLRNGIVPANKPELKVYADYKFSPDGKEKNPEVYVNPDVNTYQTTNGIIYRVFVNGEKGMQCMDILMPLDSSPLSKEAKIIYGYDSSFVADFKPKRNEKN